MLVATHQNADRVSYKEVIFSQIRIVAILFFIRTESQVVGVDDRRLKSD